MKKQYIGLIIVLCVILAIFAYFITYNAWPHLTGKKIILATWPVDPFDPFMGQYMTINYEISRISDANVTGFVADDSIYVLLKEDEQGIWRRIGAQKNKPEHGDFIKGKVTSSYSGVLRIEYGIEQYYFEKGANVPTRNVTVEATVTNSGRAKIVQLYQNGKPVEIKYKKFDIKS